MFGVKMIMILADRKILFINVEKNPSIFRYAKKCMSDTWNKL